jgi:hypothetical protein
MPAGPAAALLINWKPSKQEERVRSVNAARLVESKAVFDEFRFLGTHGVQTGSGWLRLAVSLCPGPQKTDRPVQGMAPGYPKILEEIGVLQLIPGVEGSFENARTLTRDLLTLPTHRWIDFDAEDG